MSEEQGEPIRHWLTRTWA